jgi:hypothetical protein
LIEPLSQAGCRRSAFEARIAFYKRRSEVSSGKTLREAKFGATWKRGNTNGVRAALATFTLPKLMSRL